MNSSFDGATNNAEYVRSLCPGNPCIEGIYNHSNGPIVDLAEVFYHNYLGGPAEPQNLLIQKWTDFHEKNKDRPEAKILHVCHSQGTIYTKNAIDHLPEEIRNRLIIVAIAPAMVISKDLCYDSFNYASDKDIVPDGELLMLYCQGCAQGEEEREKMLIDLPKVHDQLIRLTPHEDAAGIDHDFQSPTFIEELQQHLKKYLEKKGEFR